MIYVNGVIKVDKRNGVGSGNERGLDLAKVSFGIFDSCRDLSSSSDQTSSDPTLCQGAKGKHTRYVVPLIIKSLMIVIFV